MDIQTIRSKLIKPIGKIIPYTGLQVRANLKRLALASVVSILQHCHQLWQRNEFSLIQARNREKLSSRTSLPRGAPQFLQTQALYFGITNVRWSEA